MKRIIFLFFVCLVATVSAQTGMYGDNLLDDIWSGDVIIRIDKSDLPSEERRGIEFTDDLKTLLLDSLKTNAIHAYRDEFFEKVIPSDSVEIGRSNTLFVKERWEMDQDKTWFTSNQIYLSFAYSSATAERDETIATFKWSEIEEMLMKNRVPYKSNLSSLVTYYDIFKLKLFPYHMVEVMDQKVHDGNFQDLYNYVVDAVEGIINE